MGDAKGNAYERIYGRLSFLQFSHMNKHSQAMWIMLCDCGNQKIISANDVKRGATKSCGCLQKQRTSEARHKHGHANKTKAYRTWRNMRSRCLNKNNLKYKAYGGRGIKICKRWHSFENFLSDMGEPKRADLSIERIDVNGNYTPSNCKWIPFKDQCKNKQNTKRK